MSTVEVCESPQDLGFLGHAASSFPVGDSCFPVLLCFTVSLITRSQGGRQAKGRKGRAVFDISGEGGWGGCQDNAILWGEAKLC